MSAKGIMDFFLDWKADEYRFNRETLDNRPYRIVKEDSRYVIVLNALGVKKEDLKVTIGRENAIDQLNISGETRNAVLNKTYSVSARFVIDAESIKDIEWTTIDGLLEITVNLKEPEPSKIDVRVK